MQWAFRIVTNASAEMEKAKADYSNVHLFYLGRVWSKEGPSSKVQPFVDSDKQWIHWKKWKQPGDDPTALGKFSALGFLFGEYLSDLLLKETGRKHTVGIIDAAVSGVTVEHLANSWSVDQCYPPGVPPCLGE